MELGNFVGDYYTLQNKNRLWVFTF